MNAVEHNLEPSTKAENRKRVHPPGPANRWLGFGHVRPLLADLVGYTSELAQAHGDLLRFRIGPQWVYQVTHPDYAQEVLVHQAAAFEKPKYIQWVFRPWVGQGILFSEGGRWKRQRRLVEIAMRGVSQDRQIGAVTRFVKQEILTRVGQEFDMAAVVERLSFFALVEVIFGETDKEETEQAYEDATTLQLDGVNRTGSMTMPPRFLPTPYNRRFRAALRRFNAFFEKQFRRRRAKPGDDLASKLLAARDEDGNPYRQEEVFHGATNILFGGKETGAAAVLWPFFTLARHPDIQQKVRDEAIQIFRGDAPHGDAPAAEQLSRLTHLEAVIKETFRLYPPVPMLTRRPIRSVEIGGYHIRRGGYLFLSAIHIHRDRRWFDEPLAFRPERFSPDQENTLRPFTYFPFGGGPHACVGRQFAQLEVKLAVAVVLSTHRLVLAADQGEPKLKIDERLHPDGPLKMKLETLAVSGVHSVL